MSEPLITVLTDTREQKPWVLDASRFTMQRATLRTGDYSIAGIEDQFVIERKNLGDAVGSLISGWTRFAKELNRLASFDSAAIIVEADLSDVFAHRYESDASPESVIGRANAIWFDYGVPVFWFGSRLISCVHMVENLFAMAAKKKFGGPLCQPQRELQAFPAVAASRGVA